MGPRIRRAARVAKRAAKPRRRIRLDNDERRAQILALARGAFSERAYDEVSIDDLARDAQISKGLLYHYYPTKRDLYVAALRAIADELVRDVASVSDELAPIDRVRAGLDAYFAFIAKHSRAFVALMRGGIGSDPEVAEVVEHVRTRFFERFLTGSQFAAAFATEPRFHISLRGWIGFVEAASIDWCAKPALSAAEMRELLTRVLFEILRVVTPAMFTGRA
jgi:AcrR family transcriptional regulator